MSAPDAAAMILWVGATLYAVFGGADFGAGIWDLLARGEQGPRARALLERSLTPVWEANHVWLIFCLVVLWTAFPEAFGAIMSTLFIPLFIAALGIVLRGAGFAFRHAITAPRAGRRLGLVFSLSSLLTPLAMGTVVGAIACGRVPADGSGDLVSSWLAPAPLAIGVLFVATSAYLAAVFLTYDAGLGETAGGGVSGDPVPGGNAPGGGVSGHGVPGGRSASDQAPGGEREMVGYFARRALAAAVVAGGAAGLGLIALEADAIYLFDRLFGPALPLVLVSAVSGSAAIAILATGAIRGAHGRVAVRPLAVLAVVGLIWAWAIAQRPYLLPTDLTIADAAAPGATLTAVFIVFAFAVVLVLPALALLYTLTQRQQLGE